LSHDGLTGRRRGSIRARGADAGQGRGAEPRDRGLAASAGLPWL